MEKSFRCGDTVFINNCEDDKKYTNKYAGMFRDVFAVSSDESMAQVNVEGRYLWLYVDQLEPVIKVKDDFKKKFLDNDSNKVVVHCNTEKKARQFCIWMESVGLKWSSGDNYLGEINNTETRMYNTYKESTCYSNEGMFANVKCYEEIEYTIYEFDDIIKNYFSDWDCTSMFSCAVADVEKRMLDDMVNTGVSFDSNINILKYKKVEEEEMVDNTNKTYVLANGPFTLADVIAKNPDIHLLYRLVDDMDDYDLPCTYEFEDKDIKKQCAFNSDYYDSEEAIDWFIENGFIKEKKEDEFVLKIGDFVLVSGNEGRVKFDNEVGRVVADENSYSPGIEFFSNKDDFHDVFGTLDADTGYFVSKHLIVKILNR